MTLDWMKPLQTRDGCKARVLGRVRCGAYPVIAAVEIGSGESVMHYTEAGYFFSEEKEDDLDIINVPPAPVYGYARVLEAKEKTVNRAYPWFGPAMPTLQDAQDTPPISYAKHVGFVKLGVQEGKLISVEVVNEESL